MACVPTTFRIAQPAAQAHVLVQAAADGAGARLVEMARVGHGAWEVTLCLSPGTYHHRFYVEDGGVVVVVPGWEATPCDLTRGLDAVIQVGADESRPRRRRGRFTREEQRHDTLQLS